MKKIILTTALLISFVQADFINKLDSDLAKNSEIKEFIDKEYKPALNHFCKFLKSKKSDEGKAQILREVEERQKMIDSASLSINNKEQLNSINLTASKYLKKHYLENYLENDFDERSCLKDLKDLSVVKTSEELSKTTSSILSKMSDKKDKNCSVAFLIATK